MPSVTMKQGGNTNTKTLREIRCAARHNDIHIIKAYGYLKFDFWNLLLKSLLDFLLVLEFLAVNKDLTPGIVICDDSYSITTKR